METAPSPSSSSSPSSSASSTLTFYDFLDKMRNPAALCLVRSIKSFIVSFSFSAANPEKDGKKVQEFFLSMEGAILDHPLWAGATSEEVDCALEGLEKYVMTKLSSRTFAISSEDVIIDQEISQKIHLLQFFLRPEHLDIPTALQNEASWLLAGKELLKINAFKAPWEKLLCIMNCCRVINNLLLNASISEDHVPGGADDFLPILIYVLIQANPTQLHSNVQFIQLYRRQGKLVSEEAYYLTNLVSAKSFILDLNAKSLSVDETKFDECMQAARLASRGSQAHAELLPTLERITPLREQTAIGSLATINDNETFIGGRSNYPFMEANPGELTVEDVERLLGLYKDVVRRYSSLCRAVTCVTMSRTEAPSPNFTGTNAIPSQTKETSGAIDLKEETIGDELFLFIS